MGDKQKSKKTCKAFQDISQYFSKREWAKLSYSEKTTYVYMKRNYTTMTKLGLKANLPVFMQSKKQAVESKDNDSDKDDGCEKQ
uniref:Protein SSX1 n=1 Tax=Jaculus jaculus TaxID=51337 RepID=A0A8C5KL34_JACJA